MLANSHTIDADLLSRQVIAEQEEQEVAEKMRHERLRASESDEAEFEEAEEVQEEDEGVIAALKRRRMSKKLKSNRLNAAKASTFTPSNPATTALLRYSWLNLVPSFGLSLIYINLHVLGGLVMGREIFCKLGEEWTPPGLRGIKSDAPTMAGIVESIALLFLDLVAILTIISVLGLMAYVVDFMMSNWLTKLYKLTTDAVNFFMTNGYDAIKSIGDLFTGTF